MPEFRQTLWENIRTLTWRQLIIILRNAAFIRVRTFMVVVMGLIYGSTFYNVDPTNVQVMLGVIFQATLFLSLGQASQIPTFMEARSIFYKQRGANFYRTSAWVIANSVALVPQALGEILVFATLVYWMCGFAATASAYIIYLILLLLTNLVFASWFFCLSAMSPNLDIAKPMSTFSIVFFILFAGFVITKDQTPGWFIWVYWINPIAWCLRGLSVNEYRSSAYDVCEYGGINYCTEYGRNMGEYYLSQYGVPSDKFWIWTGILFMIVAYIFFMVLGCYVLEYHRYEAPENIQLLPKTVTDENDMAKRGGDYALTVTPKGNSSTNTRTDAGGSGEVVMDVPQREKNFVPCTIAWKDLWYSVPSPHDRKETLQLLKGVNGYAEPGSLTALMGSSGAGKTTLMDVIAGRKTGGTIEGKIYLNGYEANDLAIRRATGYCEQMDIHSEGSTIREALTFSAFLRQDSTVPTDKKYDSVNECLDLLDMHDIADQIVRGSSQEQMKRLTIGVELVAQPSVLFLDEPTSGLDAHSAKLIMDGVRKVADSGRTIVCTIHQPSSDVFFLFDHLLLLKRGGESVFVGELGENCHKLVDYLEAIPGTPPCPKGQNPATWMLEVIGAGVGHAAAATDFVLHFKESMEAQYLIEHLERPGVTRLAPELPELLFKNKRAASPFTQMRFLVQRFIVMYWRTPTYNLTRFMIAVGLALVSGLTYANSEFVSYQGVNGGVGMVFMTTLFMGIASYTGVLPIAALDRTSFYRERASQTYNSLWYFVAAAVAEIPFVFFACLLFTAIFYPLVGFQSFGTGVLYWIHLSLFVLSQAYLGQLLIFAMPSIEVAAIIGVLFNSVFLLFAGFNPPSSSIPSGYKWLYKITPQRFTLSILSALVFCDCPDEPTWNETLGVYENVGSNIGCQPMTNLPVTLSHTTVKGYVESTFKYKHDEIWANFGYVNNWRNWLVARIMDDSSLIFRGARFEVTIAQFRGGSGLEWLKWVCQFNHLAKLNRWEAEDRDLVLRVVLVADALDAWADAVNGRDMKDEAKFAEAFGVWGMMYVSDAYSEQLEEELHAFSKRRSESVSECYKRLRELTNLLSILPTHPIELYDANGITLKTMVQAVEYFKRLERFERRRGRNSRGGPDDSGPDDINSPTQLNIQLSGATTPLKFTPALPGETVGLIEGLVRVAGYATVKFRFVDLHMHVTSPPTSPMDSVAPIIKLPENYSVDNERLGLALAHVSAQANRLAEVHAVLTDRQAEQDARHKQFVEERVAQARLEAEARTQALVRAINQAYGDPTALERRVDDRIQCVLTTLQDASLSQAREMAEAQLAEQKAARRAMEERINAALVDVQERAAVRAEQTAQSLVANLNDEMLRLQQAAGSERDLLRADVELLARRTAQGVELAEERARAIAGSEVDNQLSRALTSLEDRVQLELQQHAMEERLEQRLREAIIVAKKPAEAQAREVVEANAGTARVAASIAGTDVTMVGSVKGELRGKSMLLKAARLQAQHDVAERALQRAMELKAIAVRKLAAKRVRERIRR
ncbi:hypothetical protein ON010_g9337 [Phytophthora cinnamomi]|nr:hypothetical protein ON010_g9337 [Phytophthora cinnamomi]